MRTIRYLGYFVNGVGTIEKPAGRPAWRGARSFDRVSCERVLPLCSLGTVGGRLDHTGLEMFSGHEHVVAYLVARAVGYTVAWCELSAPANGFALEQPGRADVDGVIVVVFYPARCCMACHLDAALLSAGLEVVGTFPVGDNADVGGRSQSQRDKHDRAKHPEASGRHGHLLRCLCESGGLFGLRHLFYAEE